MNTCKSLMFCLLSIFLINCQKSNIDELQTGTLKITIKNTVKGVPIVLNTVNYTNSHGEQYSISKFKYYLSNISVTGTASNPAVAQYFLIDESNPASLSFSLTVPVSSYTGISYLLGVDSARNVSGAQTGALDPLNDMFWTWNSGYIMAKMEGNSPQSTVVNNKVEYHIGGFAGSNSVLKYGGFSLPGSAVDIRPGKLSEVFIEADFDKWWQGSYDLKIADNPAVTTPGTLAKSISDNYKNMFTITEIKNY
ncbi:MAG: hypothetical protein IPL84_07715 [Chitinophagaceae bacterium]|nr:hypothetical protein [Chitinophagaceae bacterium]